MKAVIKGSQNLSTRCADIALWRRSGGADLAAPDSPSGLDDAGSAVVLQQSEDRGCRLLDRAAGNVDNGPATADEQAAGLGDLVGHGETVGVGRAVLLRIERKNAVFADLHDPLGRGDEPDRQGPA